MFSHTEEPLAACDFKSSPLQLAIEICMKCGTWNSKFEDILKKMSGLRLWCIIRECHWKSTQGSSGAWKEGWAPIDSWIHTGDPFPVLPPIRR